MMWSTIIALVVSVFLTSCSQHQNSKFDSSKNWNVNERVDIGPDDEYVEKLIHVPFNPEKQSEGYFDLYYFIHKPNKGGLEVKTILFCAGGPGETVEPFVSSPATFLRKFDLTSDYNIVYFHLRGAGLSQLPASNAYDQFLKTEFAIEDVEKIRKQLLGDRPWDGIIGYSYGTVLAQQYAGKYSNQIRKLILVGPLSTHKFNGPSSATAYDDYSTAVRGIRLEIVTNIFAKNPEFEKDRVSDDEKETIKRALAKVFETIESNFGNEEFIIDRYCKLKNTGMLNKYGLQGYSRLFFQKLRDLRNIGWEPFNNNVRANQVEAVQVISVGLMPELRVKLGGVKPDDDCAASKGDARTDATYRTLYGMRIYDGSHQRFLKEWVADGKTNIRSALRRSAGLAHVQHRVNDSIGKVGIADDQPIKVWDPANYQHNVPTLVLEGDADPVTADGQAEYYFKRALIGPRTFVTFHGVGHSFNLPPVDINQPFVIGSIRLDPGLIASGSVVAVNNRLTAVFAPGGGKVVGGPPTLTIRYQQAIFSPHSDTVFISVVNPNTSDQDVTGQQLEYHHRLFSVTVSIDSQKVPPGPSWVFGTVTKIIPNFTVEKPVNLEQGLAVESYTMVHWDELTMRIKNTTGQPIEAKVKDWTLVPTSSMIGKVRAPCQGIGPVETGSECLVYSFLEMEYEDFISDKNEILKELKNQHLILLPQHCSKIVC